MRFALVMSLLAGGAIAEVAMGQSPTTTGTAELPPLQLDTTAETTLPEGISVSRPLQPVMEAAAREFLESNDAQAKAAAQVKPLGGSWNSLELLLGWPRGHRLPPLFTRNANAIPALGRIGTSTPLAGSQPSPLTAGGRISFGWSTNPSGTLGVEASYLFLGTRQVTEETRSSASEALLGRPYVDASNGAESAYVVGSPASLAHLQVSTTTRVVGWNVAGLANGVANDRFRLTGLAGYRYFKLNESLRVEQATVDVGIIETMLVEGSAPFRPFPSVGRTALVADQFDTSNRFHGGQLGCRAEVWGNSFFAELDARVALGATVQESTVSGLSITAPQIPGAGPSSVGHGILARPSNIGMQSRTAFAVVPEGTLRLGYKFSGGTRFFAGYNFLYISDVVRPGDQVDRTITSTPVGTNSWSPGARPAPLLASGDFWLQGLSFGLEARY